MVRVGPQRHRKKKGEALLDSSAVSTIPINNT
jgi:hypothetical protein